MNCTVATCNTYNTFYNTYYTLSSKSHSQYTEQSILQNISVNIWLLRAYNFLQTKELIAMLHNFGKSQSQEGIPLGTDLTWSTNNSTEGDRLNKNEMCNYVKYVSKVSIYIARSQNISNVLEIFW